MLLKPDMASAGKAYFLASVMIVLCILFRALFSILGLGNIRIYQLYIAAMALFLLMPTAVLASGISSEFLRLGAPGARAALLCALAALVAAFMSAHLGNIIYEGLSFAGLNPATSSIPRAADAVEFVVYIFYAVIMTGVCEEIVMRGVVLSAWESRGSWRAIIASAGLFALLHGRIESFAQSFIVGIILGFVFVATDSLAASIIVHMTYNAVVIAMSFLPDEWTEALFAGGVLHSAVCVGISAAILAGLMAGIRAAGKGTFAAGAPARAKASEIILVAAGVTTMVCVTLLNLAQGLMGR